MKNNKQIVKRPSFFWYYTIYPLVHLFTKIQFHLKKKNNEIKKVKGPYIVLANHESAIDFLNLAMCTKRRLTFVISNSFYQSLKVNPLLKKLGVIPKQQFQTNISDMKKMKSVVSDNRPLAIYPAGLMTENGITTPIPGSTGKFLKWMGVDVYIAHTEGSYLTNPKWGKGFRKGQITIETYKLFSKEDLVDADPNELQALVEKHLYYDAYKNQETNLIKFKHGNVIDGLQNVLYWCPKCHQEFTNTITENNTMKCSHCGNEVYLDEYSFINPKTKDDKYYRHVSDWYKEIYNNEYQKIVDNPEYTLHDKMIIKMINQKKHQFEEVGKGELTLNKDMFIIDGVVNNEEIHREVSIKKILIFPFKPGKHLEVQDGNDIYRCCLETPNETKWIIALKVFYELNNKKQDD